MQFPTAYLLKERLAKRMKDDIAASSTVATTAAPATSITAMSDDDDDDDDEVGGGRRMLLSLQVMEVMEREDGVPMDSVCYSAVIETIIQAQR